MKLSYEHQDTTYAIKIDRLTNGDFHCVIEDREYTLQAIQQTDGAWLLKIGNQRILAYSAEEGDLRYVAVDGKTVELQAIDERARKRGKSAGAGDLSAQMPGQVVDVLVASGDSVASGQTLVILEAMKMEIRISAPIDGKIKQVLVAKGDVVGRGQKLIELERNN